MPIYRARVDAGGQFTGTDAASGLFIPEPGPEFVQTRIRKLKFHTTAPCTFVLREVDPEDAANRNVVISPPDPASDLHIEGAWLTNQGFGVGSWGWSFETTGMTGPGWLIIDYDYVGTQG